MTESKNRRTTNSRPKGLSRRERLVGPALTLLGLALAGTGVAAVFTTDSDTSAAALVAVGILLVLFGGDRLESLRYGDLEIVLRRKADEAEKRGDHEAARTLSKAADTLAGRVARASHSYKAVRRMKPGKERTDRLDEIVAEGQRAAHER